MATSLMLGLAIAFMLSGLAVTQRTGCDGACETLGLTLLYAGGPVSATFGIFFDELVLAWPLDITLWVVAGFSVAALAARRGRGVLAPTLALVGLSLAYGLVLSQLVEIAV
jgi:hypothetical protein